MFKFNYSFVLALIIILVTTLAHPQNYPTIMCKGKPVIPEGIKAVLYDQTGNFGPNSLNSQNFETMYDVYDNQAADDFIIPDEDYAWTIESVEVLGVYYNGTGPATSVNVCFYNNSGGLPGTIAAKRLNLVPDGGLSTGSFVITFASPVTLQAGTYWLSVQSNMDSANGQWGWTEQLQSNLESTWQNPGSGWGTTCTSWGYRVTNCNVGTAPYYDLSFRFNGYKGEPCSVEAASNPSPSNGETNISISGVALGWLNGAGTENVEVWFGPNERVVKVYDGQLITSWPLGTLSYNTQYRWYIICKNDTCGIQGPNWTFTTMKDTNLVIDTIDVYPQSSNNWTGTCNSSTKTQVSLVNGIYTELGWMAFDISDIPNNATINSITFNGYIYANSWPYWSITPMGSVNPVTDGAPAIYNHVSTHHGQGIAYSYNQESGTLNSGWLTRILGTTATTDLQNALTQDWFAIGIVDFDFSTSYYIEYQGWAEANKPYLTIIYSYVPATTFQLTVNVANGWNIVSIPGLHPVDQNVTTWWPGKDPTVGVFRYSGQYYPVTVAVPGKGYWMKHIGANSYDTGDEWPADGINIVPHDPINAASGWNMIGGYEYNADVSGITTTPPGLIASPVYGYFGGYYIANSLIPGYGYWVKLSGDGSINLPDPTSKSTAKISEYIKDDWGKIIIIDATGISYTLYAVKGEVDLSQYELPPPPPQGMFDIRFESGRIAEDINSSVQTIDMSGITYPLTVKVEGMDIRLQDETGKIVNANLESGQDIVISDATINKLMVTGELIPAEYSLEQNYPNPFNPNTTIEFSLPEDVSNVKLSIYNVLGEKVAELVNTALVAGKYSYQWNASNVATGIYIYELRTDKFVSIKKMVLMK
jgi:hypothetical protein